MKSGVDTPERFFFPQKPHPGGPLSPKAFTSALDRGLTKLSALSGSSGTRPQGDAATKGVSSNDISEMSQLPSATEDGNSTEHQQEDEERRDLGTPKPAQPTISVADSEEGVGEGPVGHRTKAFAFYGQVCRDSVTQARRRQLTSRPRTVCRTNRTRQATKTRNMKTSRSPTMGHRLRYLRNKALIEECNGLTASVKR